MLPLSNFISFSEHEIKNKILPESKSFQKRHVVSRLANLAVAPLSVLTSSVDGLLGLGLGLASVAVAGTKAKLNTQALLQLEALQELPSRSFYLLLKTLNPNASIVSQSVTRRRHEDYEDVHLSDIFSYGHDEGRLHQIFSGILSSITQLGHDCYNSESKFKRQVTSRLTFGLLAVSCVVARIFSLVIGVASGVLALLTLGKFEAVNTLAYKGLQITGIVRDLFFCAMKCINPGAMAINA